MKIYNAILIGESINSRDRCGVTIESFETKEACGNFIKRNPSFSMLESDFHDINDRDKPKYLTFTEALRVALDGGKIKRKDWGSMYALYMGHDVYHTPGIYHTNTDLPPSAFGYLLEDIKANDWIIVEHPPKPKIPQRLKEFKKALYQTDYIWQPRCPGDALCKLELLLEEYDSEQF